MRRDGRCGVVSGVVQAGKPMTAKVMGRLRAEPPFFVQGGALETVNETKMGEVVGSHRRSDHVSIASGGIIRDLIIAPSQEAQFVRRLSCGSETTKTFQSSGFARDG